MTLAKAHVPSCKECHKTNTVHQNGLQVRFVLVAVIMKCRVALWLGAQPGARPPGFESSSATYQLVSSGSYCTLHPTVSSPVAEEANNTCLVRLLRSLNELMGCTSSQWCLAHSKDSISVGCSHFDLKPHLNILLKVSFQDVLWLQSFHGHFLSISCVQNSS